jgi:hypothetical protein
VTGAAPAAKSMRAISVTQRAISTTCGVDFFTFAGLRSASFEWEAELKY